MNQFGKANEFFLEIRADENAAVKMRRFRFVHRLEILTIVRKMPTLADRGFIIDFPDTFDESIIKRHLPNFYTLLFRLSHPAARRETYLLFKPMIKSGYGQNGQVL